MHAVGEADMTEIVWEMYKDASKDVDSIDELQYIVHKVDAVDATAKQLVISLLKNLVHIVPGVHTVQTFHIQYCLMLYSCGFYCRHCQRTLSMVTITQRGELQGFLAGL
jgi:hypothetical protein